MADLSELDQRILDLLGVYQTAAGAWPRLRTLAERLGVSRRHVRRRLAHLEGLGYVTRQATKERPDDPGWAVRGLSSRDPGRQTSNLYRLTHVLGPLGHGESQKPSPTPRTRPESCPTGKPSTDHKPVVGDGVGSDDGDQGNVLGVSPEPWPTDDDGNSLLVALHAPEVDRLDHQPNASEILRTITSGLGDVKVSEVRRNEGEPGPTYATARGREIDLERGSVDDLHQALDQLERHTCSNGDRCEGSHRCKRHSPRRRSR